MLGSGSAGKFYFLSLLVNQLAPWIRYVCHGNNKVQRANEALKQLGFAFLSYLGQGARSFRCFRQALDAFDRHCWDAACCSRMSEVRDYRCS